MAFHKFNSDVTIGKIREEEEIRNNIILHNTSELLKPKPFYTDPINNEIFSELDNSSFKTLKMNLQKLKDEETQKLKDEETQKLKDEETQKLYDKIRILELEKRILELELEIKQYKLHRANDYIKEGMNG